MAGGWRRASIVATAGFVILLAAISLGRLWLAERIIAEWLEAEGIGPVSFAVTSLDFGGLTATGLNAGDVVLAQAVTVERKGWVLQDWVVQVHNPVLRAEHDGKRLVVGDHILWPSGSADAGSDAGGVTLPLLEIIDPTLELQMVDGPARAMLTGTLSAAGRDGLVKLDGDVNITAPRFSTQGSVRTTATTAGSARLDAKLSTLIVHMPGDDLSFRGVRLSGDLQPDFVDLDLEATLPDLSSHLTLSVAAAAPLDQPVIDARGYIEVQEVAALAERFWTGVADDPVLNAPSGGQFRLGWRADGVLDIARLLSTGRPAASFEGAFGIQSSGEDLAIPGAAENLSYALDAAGTLGAGSLVLDLGDSSVSAGRLSLMPESGLPAPVSGQAVDVTASIAATSQIVLSIADDALRPDLISLERLEVKARELASHDQELKDVSLTGRFHIDHERTYFDGIAEAASDGWALLDTRASKTRVLLPVELFGSAEATQAVILRGWATARNVRHGSGAFATRPIETAFSIRTYSGPCTLSACDADLDNLSLKLNIPQFGASVPGAGRIDAHSVVATLVARQLSLSNSQPLDIVLEIGHAESLRFGGIDDLRITGLMAPDLSSLDLQVAAERMETAAVSGIDSPDVRFRGKLTGSPAEPDFKGEVTIRETGLPPLTVKADRRSVTASAADMQAAALAELPLAQRWLPEGFGDPEGAVDLVVQHDLATGTTGLEVAIRNLGAVTDVGSFRGLNGTVRTLSLTPLITAGPQTITAELIDAGAELKDLAVTLEASTNNGDPVLHVRELNGRMFGGSFRFDPVAVDGSARPPEITLHANGLSLVALSGLMGFDEFNLGGRISGIVPFAIDDRNRIAIREARLSADGPDIMRLKLDSIGGALAAQMGDQADLLLTTLENFHYTVLEATVNKAFGENERATVRLEGRNPDHLDGQPFIFNISLDSNVVRLADTILALYRATLGEVQALALKARTGR